MKIIATFHVGMAMCSGALLAGAVITLAQDAQREPELVEKARQGDPAAQLALVIQYRDGKEVKKDNAEALRWARLAADKSAQAAWNIGQCYFSRPAIVVDIARPQF